MTASSTTRCRDVVRGRRPGPRLLAQLAVVGHPVRGPQRPESGRRALLGRLARAQAVHRLPRPVPALHERVRLPGAAAAGDDPHLRRAEADWNMTSYIMEHHQKNASGNGLMIGQMTDTFRMPKDFPSLVYLSMVLQAEAIRYGVEHWRRHMRPRARARCTGSSTTAGRWLPGPAWTTLAAGRRCTTPPGASTRRCCSRSRTRPPCQALYVTSDLREAWQGAVRWSLRPWTARCWLGRGSRDAWPLRVTAVAAASIFRST